MLEVTKKPVWLKENKNFCNILGYKFYTNNSRLNRADGAAKLYALWRKIGFT